MQGFPTEFGSMSFNVAVCAFLAVEVCEVAATHKTFRGKVPIFIWHARLKKQTYRTSNHCAICALDETVGLGAVRVGLVMSDSELSTCGV